MESGFDYEALRSLMQAGHNLRMATGIFGEGMSVMPQIYGILACGATAFISALIIFKVLDMIGGIRVSKEHELEGLDSHEHGIRGYTIILE